MEALALRLTEARKNTGLTQAQVAEKLFVTTQAVSSWECGNSIPTLPSMEKIADALGISLEDLSSDKDPMEQEEEKQKEARRIISLAETVEKVKTAADAVSQAEENLQKNKRIEAEIERLTKHYKKLMRITVIVGILLVLLVLLLEIHRTNYVSDWDSVVTDVVFETWDGYPPDYTGPTEP